MLGRFGCGIFVYVDGNVQFFIGMFGQFMCLFGDFFYGDVGNGDKWVDICGVYMGVFIGMFGYINDFVGFFYSLESCFNDWFWCVYKGDDCVVGCFFGVDVQEFDVFYCFDGISDLFQYCWVMAFVEIGYVFYEWLVLYGLFGLVF